MIPYQIIQRKRNGGELSPAEMRAFFRGYSAKEVPDYQMSALLMAIYFRGMTHGELATLVEVMLESGAEIDLSVMPGIKVDKHSTGGVGDKVSLPLAPLVSALGVPVPMMSGRGLGHTGGTLDKLESIPGFRTNLTLEEFGNQMQNLGCALIGQTDEIAPLDKRLYALRDVTATVEAIPLIASSIMSKKIAEGMDALLLDVKRGSGAFLPNLESAIQLARTMIWIGDAYDREVVALLTAMDRPLGFAVGNALEVEEAILILRNEGPEDLRELTLIEAAEMLRMGGVARNVEEGRMLAERGLADGSAFEQMKRIIEAQGGNAAVLDDPALMAQAPIRRVVKAQTSGWVDEVHALQVGQAAVRLGAGRATLKARIDAGVGFHITAKPGDMVTFGDPLATVFASTVEAAEQGVRDLLEAIRIDDTPETPALPLVSHRITENGVEEF